METSPLFWAALITLAFLLFFARRHGHLRRAWISLHQYHHRYHLHHHSHHHPYHRASHHHHFDTNSSSRHAGLHSSLLTWARHSKLHHSRESCKEINQLGLERFVQRLALRVNPTAQQRNNWEALKHALMKEGDYLNDIGEKRQLGSKTNSAPARIELQATIKLMENESLQRLQTPVLRYYLTLDERQRLEFDRIFHWPLK